VGRTSVIDAARGLVPKESCAQKAFFEYLKTVALPQHPGRTLWDFSYAVPNGTMLAGTDAQRGRYMNFLKAQGLKPGVSDVCLAIAIGRWHGAYLEGKRDAKSKVSEEQKNWLELMRAGGYYAEIAVGFDGYVAHTKKFLEG
jgi:hypothetical protein